jgi:hypothetical protein
MTNKHIPKISGMTKTSAKKQLYSRPVFQIYGKLHRVTQGGSGTENEKGGMMAAGGGKSDRRLKENIIRVGDHPLGIGLYLFDYKSEFKDECGYGRRFGVMADEVEKVMPSAVITYPDGYRAVNYEMIGISFPESSNIL